MIRFPGKFRLQNFGDICTAKLQNLWSVKPNGNIMDFQGFAFGCGLGGGEPKEEEA